MTNSPNDPDRPASGSGDLGSGSGGPPPPPSRDEEQGESEGVRFRDNRKIDPETYQARPGTSQPKSEVPDDLAGLEAQLDGVAESVAADERVVELTADLQRLSAEYANYRRRVDRDRKVSAEMTTANLMTALLPILDDLQRASEHGELEGGFRAVADAVQALAESNGVERFGTEGEPFDPNFHEAMTSDTGSDVTEPTVTTVYQVGYRIGDRVLRAARVGVTDAE